MAWDQKTGYGRFCREIVSALLRMPAGYSFTLLMDAEADAPARAEAVRLIPAGDSTVRSLPNLVRLTRAIARIRADVWFFPSPLYFVPVPTHAPVLLAIHDTIPWCYPHMIFPSYMQRMAWNIKLRLALRQARHLITVSGHARDAIARYFRLPEGKINVISEAPSAMFKPLPDAAGMASISGRLGIPPSARMIIYHGALAQHKNLRTLVRVFNSLSREPAFGDLYLVIAGSQTGSNQGEFRALRSICSGTDRVKFPGSLDDCNLVLALNRATVAVLPSFDEGFGLTGLESVACGTPLIATHSSALPEVLGDAAVYFHPLDEKALSANLTRLLANPDYRRTLRQRGLERTASLSWDSSAMQLTEIFESVLAQKVSARRFQRAAG